MKYNFQSSHGEATITSQNFPELMGLIISAECWDTDSSDLPTILMQGIAKLNDGRAVRLEGSRDVLDKYGHSPTLVIEEFTVPVLKLEYVIIDGKKRKSLVPSWLGLGVPVWVQ